MYAQLGCRGEKGATITGDNCGMFPHTENQRNFLGICAKGQEREGGWVTHQD